MKAENRPRIRKQTGIPRIDGTHATLNHEVLLRRGLRLEYATLGWCRGDPPLLAALPKCRPCDSPSLAGAALWRLLPTARTFRASQNVASFPFFLGTWPPASCSARRRSFNADNEPPKFLCYSGLAFGLRERRSLAALAM